MRHLQIIPLRQISRHQPRVIQLDLLRKIRQIVLGQHQHGFCQQNVDKRLHHLELAAGRSLSVTVLRGHLGVVFRHHQAFFALAAAFHGITEDPAE